MMSIYSVKTLLSEMHSERYDHHLKTCPDFEAGEVIRLQQIIDVSKKADPAFLTESKFYYTFSPKDYQTGKKSLKETIFELGKLTLQCHNINSPGIPPQPFDSVERYARILSSRLCCSLE